MPTLEELDRNAELQGEMLTQRSHELRLAVSRHDEAVRLYADACRAYAEFDTKDGK